MVAPTISTTASSIEAQPRNFIFPLVSLTALFFMWGFLTSLNDILIPYFKNEFNLTYTQAMLVQFCFFSAYFLISLPAGRLIKYCGYQKGIVIGLSIAAVGCFSFLFAAEFVSYALFLLSLFVLASGITILQVAANPYVTALGTEKTASGRLTMTQAFNSLGTTIAPLIGAALIFGLSDSNPSNGAPQLDSVMLPYLGIAVVLVILAAIFLRLNLPIIHEHTLPTTGNTTLSLLKEKNLIFGVIAIFLYVGAEVSIGSFLINFISSPEISTLNEAQAAHIIAYYWGGAMMGRFIGAVVMQFIAARAYLAMNAVVAMLLIAIAVLTKGSVAMYAIVGVGFFNGVMFPTIFSLALEGLREKTGQASGLLCQAIVGGALIPIIQGGVADLVNLQISFVVPMACYVFIFIYGFNKITNNSTSTKNQNTVKNEGKS